MDNVSAETVDLDFLPPLRRARLHHVVRSVVLAVLWAAAAGLIAYKLAPFASQWTARPVEPNATAFFIAAPVLVVGLAMAFGNPPPLLDLARRADQLYGLGERLSTAIGLKPAPGPLRSAMDEALRRDAASYSARISPSRLVPAFNAVTGATVVLLIAAICLFALLPAPPSAQTTAAIPTASAPVSNPATRSENLKTIADILSADAEKRGSSYLTEVANAVSRLADARDLAADDSKQQLTGLLDNARLAYGARVPNWLLQDATAPGNKYGLTDDNAFTNLAQRAAAANVADPKAGGGEEMVPELLSEQGLQHAAVPAPPPGQLRIAPQDDADLAINQMSVGGNPSNSNVVSGQAKSGPLGGTPPSLGDTDPASHNLDAGSAVLEGGATQSGQGASRLAGGGTQDLNDPGRITAAPIKPAEEVLLPPGDYKQGKRLRVQITPETSTATATDSQGHTIATPGPVEQTPVTRDVPSVRDQAIFSRFFTHDEAEGGA